MIENRHDTGYIKNGRKKEAAEKLSDIELFLNVAKYGSFTKAGEKMFMTQSWVSKRISQIERELDLRLFLRNKRSLSGFPFQIPLIRELF